MSDLNPIINGFTAGEISPRLKARTDLDKYRSAAQLIENFIIIREGGLLRRSGTRYVGTVYNQAKKSRLVPFIFSTDDAYILEFAENLIRIYTNEAITVDTVVTTYTEAELFDLRFAQSGDFLYIAHQSHHPAQLKRQAGPTWVLENVPFEAGPWQDPNREEDLTIANTGTSGTVVLTATQNIFTAYDDDDEGRMFFLGLDFDDAATSSDAWGWGQISVFNGANSVDAIFDAAHKVKGVDATRNEWRFGAFSPDPAIGYPASVCLFEGRLCWAGTVAQPDTVWGSETGIYNSHRPSEIRDQTVIDSHSINYTLASGEMNRIDWMYPMRAIILGSAGAISSLGGSGSDAGLTPTSVLARRITNVGSKAVDPVLVGQTLCYASKFGSDLIGLSFSFAEDSFTPSNLTLLSEHILKSPVVQLSYAQYPLSLIYAVRLDGVLPTLTLIPDQDVFGWSRQIIGGSFGTGAAVVESVATIPSPDETHDQTWVVVKRTIAGATRRYIEFFEDSFSEDTDIEDAFFVDCGKTYSGAPATTITGLSHLEGETVDVLADGSVHPQCLVSGGQITLTAAASKVHVGYGFNSNLRTLNLEESTSAGTRQGKVSRVVRAATRFYNTVGGKIGRDANNLDPLPGRPSDALMGAAVEPTSGDVVTAFSGDYTHEATIYVRQDQPLPMTILGIMPEIATGARA